VLLDGLISGGWIRGKGFKQVRIGYSFNEYGSKVEQLFSQKWEIFSHPTTDTIVVKI